MLLLLLSTLLLQGLLPHCKDVLLDPRSSFGVPGIHDYYQLDALDWLQIAENVPGFEAVVSRCITQIVASATSSRGRSQRMAGSLDQPRWVKGLMDQEYVYGLFYMFGNCDLGSFGIRVLCSKRPW